MNDEELRDYLKRFCFGREHLICSCDLVRQKNLRESDLRKKVNRLRRKAVPIASSREGYFYASNAAELYSTIRQLKEMRAGLDAAICGLEQAMEKFSMACSKPEIAASRPARISLSCRMVEYSSAALLA